jgi:hypothetical protein
MQDANNVSLVGSPHAKNATIIVSGGIAWFEPHRRSLCEIIMSIPPSFDVS